jgi:ribosome-binding factor A
VAAPIEQQVNGVENMLYMASVSSNDGSYTLTITFQPGIDLNIAQILVQNRVNLALPVLPELVRRRGVTVTGVEVSPDLENAWVYVSVLGTAEEAQEALAGLKSATGFLRREIAAALSLRIVPHLMFRLDDSIERGMRIDRLLDSIVKTRSSTPDAHER